MTRVGILVFDGMTLLDLSGPAEVLSRAPGYEITLFSPTGGTVTAGNGLQVTGCVPPVSSGLDTVIITGADALPDGWDPALLHACSTLAQGARRVASICTGAFLLAELGLLDGRRATTHWRNARDLARRYPRVRVEADTLHIHDGKYLTSAGITAGIDLALSLVEEDHGAAEARHIAQDMVVFMHRPGGQSQFADAASTVVDHPILRSVVESVHADPTGAHTVTSLAESAAVSSRHLGRLFRDELGTTPAQWLEQFRLSTAQQLILDGHTITAAARNSGFGSDETLRRAFERRLHVTPTEYRARFSSTFRA